MRRAWVLSLCLAALSGFGQGAAERPAESGAEAESGAVAEQVVWTPAQEKDLVKLLHAHYKDIQCMASNEMQKVSGRLDSLEGIVREGARTAESGAGAGAERAVRAAERKQAKMMNTLWRMNRDEMAKMMNTSWRMNRDEMRKVSGRLDSLEGVVREGARPAESGAAVAEAVSGLAGELAGVARLLKVLLALVALLAAAFVAAAGFAVWRGRTPVGDAGAGPGAGAGKTASGDAAAAAGAGAGAGNTASGDAAAAGAGPDAGPGAADGVARRRIEGEEHKVFIGMATDLFRLRNNLDKVDDGQPGKRQAQKAMERMETTLRARGYTIESPLGLPYNDGMAFQASFVMDESLPAGKSVITRVSSPQVNYRGRMVQSAAGTVSMH